jgi:hypothetical protein
VNATSCDSPLPRPPRRHRARPRQASRFSQVRGPAAMRPQYARSSQAGLVTGGSSRAEGNGSRAGGPVSLPSLARPRVGWDRGQVSAPGRSPRRSRGAAPQARRPVEGRPGSCLSFCLIHPRPAPFTNGRPSRVRAGHGRWRTVVNAGQHCWKACWGRPLGSSNLPSSATLTCGNSPPTRCHIPAGMSAVVSIVVAVAPPGRRPSRAERGSALRLCLVTAAADGPEPSATRR